MTHTIHSNQVKPKAQKENKKNKGFIQIIVLIIIALVILRLLKVNIIDILSKPVVKDFALYVKDMLKAVWADLISIFNFAKSVK